MIMRRRAKEWNEQESMNRGGYVEFAGNLLIAVRNGLYDGRPEEASTFLYYNEFCSAIKGLFEEPQVVPQVGDWIKPVDYGEWILVSGILQTENGEGETPVYYRGITHRGVVNSWELDQIESIFQTEKPE